MRKKWQIFVIFHKQLIDSYYKCDPSFDHQYYTFIKTNPKFKESYNIEFGYKVIKECELDFYDFELQENNYLAASAIYHVYKNGLHHGYDAVGFLEYDIPLIPDRVDLSPNITDYIKDFIKSHDRFICPMSFRHSLSRLWGQSEITMNGINSMTQIVIDYNEFFDTRHDPELLSESNDIVGTQQSFLTDVKSFEEFMPFVAHVVEKRLPQRPGSFMRPSTLMDRYYALSMYFGGYNYPIPLIHKNMKQWNEQ